MSLVNCIFLFLVEFHHTESSPNKMAWQPAIPSTVLVHERFASYPTDKETLNLLLGSMVGYLCSFFHIYSKLC
jgi:hypothetical protein